MLQNLGVAMPLASWDVADPEERALVLDSLEDAICHVALPYFRLFEDADALVKRLEAVPVPSFHALSTLEWLLWHDRRDSAIRHAQLLLSDDRLRRRFERARAQVEQGELQVIPHSEDAEALAYAALAHNLTY
jgi:hypothetical protein